MDKDFKINSITKKEKYIELIPLVKSMFDSEHDAIANMANLCAILKYSMNFFWVGFYLIKNEQLVLGPFQGPVACTRINKGKGVCGTSWQKKEVLIVPDVNEFPGHIACSSLSKSEIVIPIFDSHKTVVAVLDVDSDNLNNFDELDEMYLKELLTLLHF